MTALAGEPRWSAYAPTWTRSVWIHAIRHAPPWIRRPLQRHFREAHEKKWSAPLDIVVRGLKFRCHFKDNTPEYKLVFQGRRYDNWHLRKLRPFLRANGTFIDVGANFGFFALNAAKAMGNRCKVIAIEPNGTMATRLRENIRLNGFDCITVREVAVGETHGFASGRFGAGDHGLRGYGRVEASALVDQPISMLPLLSIVRDAGIEKIDVLKIDIEGYEDQALKPFFSDAPRSLWPHIVAIEDSHRNKWDSNVIDRLLNAGYRTVARGRVDHILRRDSV